MSWLSLKYSFAWALSYHLAVFTYFCVLIFLSGISKSCSGVGRELYNYCNLTKPAHLTLHGIKSTAARAYHSTSPICFPGGSALLQKETSLQKAAHSISSGCAETAPYSTASMLKQPLTA